MMIHPREVGSLAPDEVNSLAINENSPCRQVRPGSAAPGGDRLRTRCGL